MSKVLRYTIFVSCIAGLLLLGDAVIASAVAAALGMGTPQLLTLNIVFGILSLSFILSTLLGNRYYNWFTRIYYYWSSVWVGLLTYLFIASVVYALLALVFQSPLPQFGAGCLLAGLAVALYGVVHARKIYIKEVSVTIPDLPESWRGRRLAWTSDIHLGQIYSERYSKRIVDTINAAGVDIAVVGGDLFDGTEAPDLDALVAPFKNITASLGAYFISGNHEEFGDNSKFIAAVKKAGLKILNDEKLDIEEVQLVGVDYQTTSDAPRFKEVLRGLALDRARPIILLKHEPLNNEVAEEAGVSLQISGHTHDGQLWPFGYIARKAHKGFSYGLKRLSNLQIYTSSGTGTWGPPLRVGTDCEIVIFSFTQLTSRLCYEGAGVLRCIRTRISGINVTAED